MDAESFQSFLTSHTRRTRPSLCKELRTRESTELVPFWEAVENEEGREVEPPFWACSWPGSQALARYVLDHREIVVGQVVLDLGCGNGIAAIASALAGCTQALANDIDEAALWMTRINAEENGQDVRCLGDDLLSGAPPVPPVDLILVGDLFYAKWLAVRVEPWLRAAIEVGARVLIGDPGRAYLPTSGLELLESYEVPVAPAIESVDSRSTSVYRLRRL